MKRGRLAQSKTKGRTIQGSKTPFRIWNRSGRWTGLTQMTLVESALCPLDPKVSKKNGSIHLSHFNYYDKNGKRKQATIETTAAFGLSPNDDFYLWGLLALTFAQPEPSALFYATPHYCLTQLGVISEGAGGKNYKNFRSVLKRLAGVVYSCNAFYDPIRGERSDQTFHLLSYSRPRDSKSSRVWRIAWDPLLFDYVAAGDGHFCFDLSTYRNLDPASRRLFLLLRKIFHRRRKVHFAVRELAVQQLGYSAELEPKKLKASLKRCLNKLLNLGIISLGTAGNLSELFEVKKNAGQWLTIFRGQYFEKTSTKKKSIATVESAASGPLSSIGFNTREIAKLLRQYSMPSIQELSLIHI